MANEARSGGAAAPGRPARLLGGLVLANLLAWGWAILVFAERPAMLSAAFLAWVLGLRHAVDADHIAAIDNVVRKLAQEGAPADAVGFWFSLGHSTVVVSAAVLVAVMAQGAEGALLQAGSFGGTLGTLASGLFLVSVGLVNLGTLGRIWRSLRSGATEPAPAPQGLLAWATAPLLGSIRRARHMYPLGLLFGLGFDTAAAIGLLALGATQALQGMPPWQAPALLMVFPALFTAAMLLVDTADSVLMTRAYGWAFVEPARKLRYNFVVTALSVVLALLIGGTELLGLIGESWALPALLQASLDAMEASLGLAGFGMIAVFALCWGGAVLLQRRQEARAG